MKRVLMTGVFGSGKTTLINLLKEELEKNGKTVKIVSEIARECPLSLNHKQNLTTTSWLVMGQIRNELMTQTEENNFDFILYDRGIPDIIAHTELIIETKSNESLLYFQKLKELGVASIAQFDYIFLSTRSERFHIQSDNIRINDIEFQMKLDKLHIKFLTETGTKFTLLPEKNDDRLPKILKQIL